MLYITSKLFYTMGALRSTRAAPSRAACRKAFSYVEIMILKSCLLEKKTSTTEKSKSVRILHSNE